MICFVVMICVDFFTEVASLFGDRCKIYVHFRTLECDVMVMFYFVVIVISRNSK